MSFTADISAKSAPRLPAWKRLGLKLKSASDAGVITKEVQSPKRKQSPIENITKFKKIKVGSQVSQNAIQNPTSPHLTRKKSVSFTPETKIDDGDSVKQLFSGWAAEQKEQDPSFNIQTTNAKSALRTVEAPVIVEEVDTTLDEKVRRVMRVNREKTGKKSIARTEQKQSASTAPPRPFLQYLHLYHDSRDTWKFNKNHQNHLLKHAFNVSIVPIDHSLLLYEYIRGLQGGVRTRLRDTALSIKVEDQESSTTGFPTSMTDKDNKQFEYDLAMKEYVATMMAAENAADIGYEEGLLLGLSDSAMYQRAARRMRSERILAELAVGGITDQPEDVDMGEDGHFTKELGAAQKVARKRKQRTVVVDESSSSDSSVSDSSSNEDSDEPDAAENNKGPSNSSSSSGDSTSSTVSSDSDSQNSGDSDDASGREGDSD